MRAELERMRRRAEELEREMAAEVEKVRRSLKAEIVPYKAYEVIPADQGPVRIPVERPEEDGHSEPTGQG
jgi:hypothetical protein